jgi:hypothetical protein
VPMLVGIEGVSAGEVEAVCVRSRTAAIQELRAGAPAIIAAGDEGSLVVWVDDDGKYRCEFDRFLAAIDQKKFRHLAAVDQWLREWFPKMHR